MNVCSYVHTGVYCAFLCIYMLRVMGRCTVVVQLYLRQSRPDGTAIGAPVHVQRSTRAFTSKYSCGYHDG